MKDASPIVHLVDDEPNVLKALSRLLHSAGHTVRAFPSARAFLDDHQSDVCGCLVLDLTMPGLNGLQLQEELARLGSTLPIIFLTGNGDVRTSVRAMKEGAIDFLTKPVNDEELLAAIQRAFAHNLEARRENADQSQIREKLARLTPREHEVLVHIVAGKLNKQVASDLGTVEKTIKVHRARIMEKLEVDSLADLVRLVEKAGIQPAK